MISFSEDVFKIETMLYQLKRFPPQRLVLLGAGAYGETLLGELLKRGVTIPIVFSDNDITKQGRRLQGRDIISPQAADPSRDFVIITTISAGDQVSIQLEGLGFKRDVNYFEVLHKLEPLHAIDIVRFYRRYVPDIEGKTILHIGPGGFLGVELLLLGLGAKRVVTVEYHSYGLRYPDVTPIRSAYEKLAVVAGDKLGIDLYSTGLLKEERGRLVIDSGKVSLLHPCSVTALPFDGNTFDLVLHHAVFEHVPEPYGGYQETFRVLKPMGMTIGLVDPQDHRNFASFDAYGPLTFLTHSRDEWNTIAANINFHNQITTPEHRAMISMAGFNIREWDPLMQMTVTGDMMMKFDSYFQQFDPVELGVLRFAFSAVKPAEK